MKARQTHCAEVTRDAAREKHRIGADETDAGSGETDAGRLSNEPGCAWGLTRTQSIGRGGRRSRGEE